jgi:DMSO/TMAO reductase YedYZ molybdopterin-dependent catalytic subunit
VSQAHRRGLAAALCAAWICCGCPAVAQSPAEAKYVSNEVRVTGNVERPLTLSVSDLKRLPVVHVEDRHSVGEKGKTTEIVRQLTGCRLRDVLDAAGLAEKVHRDLRKSYVVAAASDAYEVVFSWGELYNSPVGDGVLVIFEADGAQLPDSEGRIALVSLKDLKTGPRHVKWLARIDVRLAVD